MKIGCHCVLFGAEITSNAENILRDIGATGARGVEIGARFMASESVDEIMQALQQNGLELAGYHVSRLLCDIVDKWEDVYSAVQVAAKVLAGKPNRNIIFTGMPAMEIEKPNAEIDKRLEDEEFVKQIALGFEKLAVEAEKLGVKLNYHNHSWEFARDKLIFNALCEYAHSLNFALDIGWAAISGLDVEQFVVEYAKRVGYVHLRDYKKADAQSADTFAKMQECYCELGDGDAFHWETLLPLLAETVGENGWCIVEYEKGEPNPLRYKKALEFVSEIKF